MKKFSFTIELRDRVLSVSVLDFISIQVSTESPDLLIPIMETIGRSLGIHESWIQDASKKIKKELLPIAVYFEIIKDCSLSFTMVFCEEDGVSFKSSSEGNIPVGLLMELSKALNGEDHFLSREYKPKSPRSFEKKNPELEDDLVFVGRPLDLEDSHTNLMYNTIQNTVEAYGSELNVYTKHLDLDGNIVVHLNTSSREVYYLDDGVYINSKEMTTDQLEYLLDLCNHYVDQYNKHSR